MSHPITEQEFNALAAQGYNRIPLVAECLADLDTPLSLYLKLANRPYSYLLESVQGGERFGRYSFIGLPADTRISVRGNLVSEGDGDQAPQHPRPPLQHVTHTPHHGLQQGVRHTGHQNQTTNKQTCAMAQQRMPVTLLLRW